MNAKKQIGEKPNGCPSVSDYLKLAERQDDMRKLFISKQLVEVPADLKSLFLALTEPCNQARDLRMLVPRATSAYQLTCARQWLQSRVVSWNEPQSVKLLADCDPTKIDMPEALLVHDDYSSRYGAVDRFQFATYERVIGRSFLLRTYSLIPYDGRGDGLLSELHRCLGDKSPDRIVYAGFNPKLGPDAHWMIRKVDNAAQRYSALYHSDSLAKVIARMIIAANECLMVDSQLLEDPSYNLGPLFTLRAFIDGAPVNVTLSRSHLFRAQEEAVLDKDMAARLNSAFGKILQSLRSGGEVKSGWCLVLRDGLTGYYPYWSNCAFNNPAILQEGIDRNFTNPIKL